MTERVVPFIIPNDPEEKARAMQINRERGYGSVPGMMDQEAGGLLVGDSAFEPYQARITTPEWRSVAGPARWWPLFTVPAIVAVLAALAGLLAK